MTSTSLSGSLKKTDIVTRQLHEMALALGPKAKLPTHAALRSTLGVSGVTLNSALADLETQQVLYRIHGSGIYVSPDLHRKNVALIFDPIFLRGAGHSPFWDVLARECQACAVRSGESLELHLAKTDSKISLNEGLQAAIVAGTIDGIVGVGLDQITLKWIEEQGVPCVSYAAECSHVIVNDGLEFQRLAVGRLVGVGCKHIGLWMSIPSERLLSLDNGFRSQAFEEFESMMAAYGLEVEANLCRRHFQDLNSQCHILTDQEQGYHLAHEVFSANMPLHLRPDGLIIDNDMMAQGALTAFHKLGVRVGQDVQIVSHANRRTQVLFGWEEAITMVEYDPALFATIIFQTLETLMKGGQPPQQRIFVQPQLRC